MDVVDLRYKIITNDDDQFSFQLFDAKTNRVVITAPEWWASREEAQQRCDKFRSALRDEITKVGITVESTALGDVASMDIPESGARPGNGLAVMSALAVHRDTGKYGFVVLSNRGDAIMKPEKFYDTPIEAFTAAEHATDDIKEALYDKGMSDAKIIPPIKEDFVSDEVLTAVNMKKHQYDEQQKLQRVMPSPYPFNLKPTIDASRN
jgi:hypothetical protein